MSFCALPGSDCLVLCGHTFNWTKKKGKLRKQGFTTGLVQSTGTHIAQSVSHGSLPFGHLPMGRNMHMVDF